MTTPSYDGEPELTVAWLVQALGIVREVSTHNESYNPHTLAALHWGERAVQRIAELEAEMARLRSVGEAAQEMVQHPASREVLERLEDAVDALDGAA